MNKIFKEALRHYRNWRYRRLYHKLFWFYAKRNIDGEDAGSNAAAAFEWIIGKSWSDFLFHDYYGYPYPEHRQPKTDEMPSFCEKQ